MSARSFTNWSEAFKIFAKYDDEPGWKVHPEHDEITIGVNPEGVSPEDLARLEELGFTPDSEGDDYFHTFT